MLVKKYLLKYAYRHPSTRIFTPRHQNAGNCHTLKGGKYFETEIFRNFGNTYNK